ncbi:hypothetical protein FGLOB1_7627 [Fusarium globosum]|uniref:Methyltransferase n=1 Tax=Fusarium globosum TaxID=78864 RepID=A0A8H6D6F1_9HYPO|nr:hypothetical protein FGLOB1_7627 [Fusarium globosum]
MVSTPRLLSSSGEQLSKLSQQDGLVGAHVSTNWLISSWLATHANGSTEPDTDSSTIDSHENSDAEFDHDIYDPMNDEHVSDTEYNDPDRTIDDEGFHELDTVSVISLDSVVENYLYCCRRQYPNPGTGYSYEPIDPERTELWEEMPSKYCGVRRLASMVFASTFWIVPTDHENKRVLDIGTGTGTWAIDLADNNPGIRVTGIDIAPFQPRDVPPNLDFQIDDCNEESTFAESSIDYIHARNLGGNVDRTMVTRNAFKTLKPGGIVEFDELAIDFDVKQSDADLEAVLGEWKKFFVKAGEKRRTPFIFVNDETLQKEVESAGFEDVQVCTFEIPLDVDKGHGWHSPSYSD